MKKNLLLFFSTLLTSAFACAQDITGTWSDKITTSNATLTIVFHITQTDKGYLSTLDSPDQGAMGLPTGTTTFTPPHLTIEIPALNASYNGELKEDGKIYGTFKQFLPYTLNLQKRETSAPKRPQEPQAPFPYKTEEVKFRNNQAGITLAGTLTIPQGKKEYPAIVLVTGSGPQNRNEEIMGHKPFLLIADYLTRRGIAVLRYDDRGTAASEGDFKSSTSENFATDAEAAIAYLRTRKEINSQQIGILGHSEGGSIAFMQAAKNKEVAFIISLAGVGVKGDSLMLKQAEAISKSQGMPDAMWQTQAPILRKRYALLTQDKTIEDLKKELYEDVTCTIPAAMQSNEAFKKQLESQLSIMTSPWYIYMMNLDPTADLKKIKCPVLALNGTSDIQVDAEMNLTAIENSIRSNGNKNVTTKRYPGLNHLFQHCKTCTVNEYGELEETFSEEVLKDITDWILEIATKNKPPE